MPNKGAIYRRCSTQEQHVSNQILELQDIAKRKGLSIISEYSDGGISGVKGRNKRTRLGNLIKGDEGMFPLIRDKVMQSHTREQIQDLETDGDPA